MPMTTKKISERSAHAGLMLASLIVGLSFPAVGLISEDLPPLTLTAIRFAIAAAVIGPAVLRMPGFWPGPRGLVLHAILGLCLAAFFGTMFWAAHRTTPMSMATIFVAVPLLAYLMGRALKVEIRSTRLVGILATGAVGALALIWAQSSAGTQQFRVGLGEASFFFACACIALNSVLNKLGLEKGWLSSHAAVRTFWTLIAGTVQVGLLAVATESPRHVLDMNLQDGAVIAYLAVFSSAVTFWLSQRAAAVLTPGITTAYGYTSPFVAMLLLFYTEPQQMGWHWLPGSLLVITAIAFLFHGTGRGELNIYTAKRLLHRDAAKPCMQNI